MPVYQIPKEYVFPSPEEADPSGLLAVGGDLSLRRLLLAYCMGVFPWYCRGEPILWWSPDPRLILEPGKIKISRSLRRVLKKGLFHITMDRDFPAVIQGCAEAGRRGDPGTWIVPDMIFAYTRLHTAGFAHSVETWLDGRLVGGLYGVSIGGAFFGESMFSLVSDASKAALVYLAAALRTWNFNFIDCQVTTGHLVSMGAREVPRREFLEQLSGALRAATRSGAWGLPDDIQLF
jgi:leucyl/phenylalanyl-tRNA---protein transferase